MDDDNPISVKDEQTSRKRSAIPLKQKLGKGLVEKHENKTGQWFAMTMILVVEQDRSKKIKILK